MSRIIENYARGQQCYARFPLCNGNTETTVLCHIRRGSVGGMGLKPPSVCALPMCSTCHDCYDSRIKTDMTREEMDAEVLRGLVQWLTLLTHNKVIKV